MNSITRVAGIPARTQADHITIRVLDAMIREDYRGLASDGIIVPAADMPSASSDAAHILVWSTQRGRLLIPVRPSTFMQDWRVANLPLQWETGDRIHTIGSITEMLEILGMDLDEEGRTNLDAFRDECLAAIEQGVLCALAHAAPAASSHLLADHPQWHRSMLEADRLGSFVDHPFYPTARAKLGFEEADLRAFGPEHGTGFQLSWLAVPKEGFTAMGEPEPFWPSFEQVGLARDLAQTHRLIPFHPFMRGARIEAILQEAGVADRAFVAPNSWLDVIPTLSVRAVAVAARPGLHIKLPLAISTLGRLNLRAIKPDTIHDGALVQSILGHIGAREPDLRDILLLTDESRGGCHSEHRFLGYILRRYPDALDGGHPVPAAALLAPMRDGRPLLLHLAEEHFDGEAEGFLTAWFDLLLTVHLRLWAGYGIALEANQQNSVLVLGPGKDQVRLLLKDNDGPRIHRVRLAEAAPDLADRLAALRDPRIAASDDEGLAQMVTTITVQLNLACIVEGLAAALDLSPMGYYRLLRERLDYHLARLRAQGLDVAPIKAALIAPDRLPLKYLLRAASLETRAATKAADVNKFYGRTAPNVLKVA